VSISSSDCEPIAVIGIAFRFTRKVDLRSLGEGWQAAAKSWQAAAETSSDRVEFDRDFFDLSDSAAMPVGDRVLLELAWSALTDAGVVPDELAGQTAGVFLDSNAGGVAKFLRLTGPVVPVPRDASSAVLAVQAACRSLAAGECDLALAGGAHPDFGVAPAGAGVLALTPLSRAEAAGDLIRYAIREHASLTESATGSAALAAEAGLAGLFAATARLADPAADDIRIMAKDGQLVLSPVPPANRPPAPPESSDQGRLLPWVLSAKTTRSLRGQAARLAAHVAAHEELDPADVAYSLITTRPDYSHRAVVLAADRVAFAGRLSALTGGDPSAGVIEGRARPGRQVAFLFPGEGGQRPGMGRELYHSYGVFADALDEACERIAAHGSWSVRELLLGEEEPAAIAESEHALYTQDGLFALQFALFRLLTHWEVPVDYVLGHSVGEFAAATAAGVFTLDDAAALMAERVRLVRRHMPVGGAMAAIAISADEAMESIAGNEERVSVAAINGPSSVVLSGDLPVVSEIVRQWAERGRKVKVLPVNRAFHSHHFDPLLPDFERFLELLPRSAPRIPFVSVLYGRLATAEEVCAPGYLPQQVRGTSRFLSGVRWLEAAGVDTFVELSASGVLSALGPGCLSQRGAETAVWVPALRGADRSDEQSLLTAVAQLHVNGVHVSWHGPLRGSGRRVRLPGYAFEPVPGARDDSPGGPAGALAAATHAERTRLLLDLVRAELAAVLERPDLVDIDQETPLLDLGFTSLAVVELAKKLTERVGIRVGAPLIFDHPSPLKLAAELARRLRPDPGANPGAAAVPAAAAAETVADPIAIVGMSCRFPGGVRSPEELWEILAAERDVISGLPANRDWSLDALYDPEPGRPGRSYVREGGFLVDAGEFDAAFFGISPVEALGMDPQQRLLLESAWEALERAGIDPVSVRGSRTGVFAGLMHAEYGARSLSDYGGELGGPASGAEAYLPLGTATSIATGRIAYALGLEGPAVTLDTACSSSLVALHLAAQALRCHECDLALAGAAAVMGGPLAFLEFSRQRALAPDARCKPFSASANGTAWSEGVGMLVVERLSDALRHGHPVLAVLRGSAVNSDGASNGLTAPNGLAQERVIRAALSNAGLRPDEVDAVEAHGTGTTLGDPIEAEALLATYGRGRAADRPLLLGSVKSNIGHAQVAAGMAGVIKMVLAIKAGEIPATLHFDRPSGHVDWDGGAVEVVTRATPWPVTGAPRRAGVSAFGISGTNAHIILEEPAAVGGADRAAPADGTAPADQAGPAVAPVVRSGAYVWPLSGRTTAAVRAQAARLAAHTAACPDLDPADVGWSLVTTRSIFPERAVVTGVAAHQFAAGLAALAAGEPAVGVVTGAAPAGKAGKTVFVFPGQGSQWAGMGQELAACSPVFAVRLAECAAALAPYVDWDLSKVLAGELETADTVQPALWAVMVSLAAVWEAAGVVPDAVVGHSQGEIAAACVAGILSLEDAARVVALRSRALLALAGRGGLLSVASPADLVRRRLEARGDRLWVAAVNGPSATVVGGEPDALDELAVGCEADGVRVKRVPVDYASHGPAVEELRGELLSVLRGISPRPFRIPMISAMTGQRLRGPEADAAYWYESLRAPVEFDRAVRALADSGHGVFIEVSPHPVVAQAIADSIDATVIGTLRRDDGGPARLLASLAEAWTHGAAVNWATVVPRGQRVDLPTYAFQRQRYWPELSRWPAVGSDGAGRSPRQSPAAGGWRYRVSWVPVPEPDSARLPRTWLVVVPEGHAARAEEVGRALAARGAETVVVRVAAGRTGRRALAACAGAARDAQPAGVVSLLALDETPLPAYPVVAGGLAGTLELVQALGDAGVTAPLWVVTRRAMGTGPGEAPASPVQAQAWGLGRVAGLEHPRRWGGLVDLPPTWDDRVARQLCGVLAGGTGEDEVAIRGSGVLARRLVRVPSRRPADSGADGPRSPGRRPLRGTVLLTGGTGAIGPHLAGWLARGGAEHVVLPSRTGPAAPAVAALAAGLSAAGVRVSVLACDIARREPLAGLLRWMAAAGPPLRAVVHAAVSIDLAPLEAEGIAGLAAGLAAKVAGAVLLDELTAAEELDSFVLFSSITGVWGSGYHGAYAAANAHLDALAVGRRARGLPATSVAWGVWEAGSERGAAGAVPQSVSTASLRRQGLGFLNADRALEELAQVLADDETAAVVADVDWAHYAPVYRAAREWRIFDEIPEARAPARAAGQRGWQPDTGLMGRLAQLSAAGRERAVTDLVRAHAAAVLGHQSASEVAPDRAFREMGFDSLTAVQLRDRLNEAAGFRLSSTVVFDFPSPVALARHVLGQLPGAVDARSAPPAPATAPPGDPVVIVGMGCRFPGGVSSPDDLWELVTAGKDVVSRFPQDRGWDTATLYNPDPDHAGTSYTRQGGFLDDAAGFDAGFFGISPREARAMDPQQRLLLEVCWEALERAGINPASLSGAPAGVFAGASQSGYEAGPQSSEGHSLTGNASSVLSGRVSYILGLEGPSVTLDTACSSSLVALHLAAQALRAGDCDLALAGGVAIMASPAEFVGFSSQRALSADGRCKAFGAAADGMGLAEGAGVLVLERLTDARRRGHRVLAVVAGSAVNSDGASNGLTAPNGPSQERVIKAALASAGLTAIDVDAIEAHGTGTRLGDPIEAQALLATYGQERPEGHPVWLGSVKSNIGHAQAAAGAAGVIKTVLALRHGRLPRTLHASEPSPEVDWTSGAVSLLTEPVPWPPMGRPRRAGVSAFGMSGTNAHVILQEAPVDDQVQAEAAAVAPAISSGALAWLVSGRSAAGLAAQARRLLDFAVACPDADPAGIGWSLATARAALECRAAVTGASRAELLAGLAAVAAGEPASGVVAGPAGAPGAVGAVGKTVFVFPGQGSQWTGMGARLAAASPVFAARLAECSAALAPYVDWSLPEVLAGELESADVAQPALWAVMVSLASVWEAAGVIPDAVVGHSQGEIAAACVAGILSLPDAAKVVALRSRALTALAGRGGMLSVALPADVVRGRLSSWGDRLSVAAVNGPGATVVSGEPLALGELTAACEADGVRVRRVPVDYASHSAQVEELQDEILTVLRGISPRPFRIPMISAMTGEALLEAGPQYWYESLRAPVEFDRAVRALAADGFGAFVEVSPHPVLVPAISESVDALVTGTLRRDDGGPERLLASLAAAWTHGAAVDWSRVLPAGQRVDLPTYAFQHQRYWPGPAGASARDLTAAGLRAVAHPLLGAVVELAGSAGLILTGQLSVRAQPWLADHEVAGTVLVPGTALVEMAVRAAVVAGCGRVEELALAAPLVLTGDGAVQVQVSVGDPDGAGRRPVEVFARPGATSATGDGGPWTRHASGVLAPEMIGPAGTEDLAEWPPPEAVPVPTDGLYDHLAALGYRYGPVFRGLRAAWRRDGDIFAEVALPEEAAADAARFGIHPALLDAALQAVAMVGRAEYEQARTVWLPFAWSGVCLHAASASALRIRLRQDADGVMSLTAADAVGAPVVSVESLVSRSVDARQLAMGQGAPRDCLFAAEWVPAPVPAAGPAVPGDVVVIDAGSAAADGARAARAATWAVLGRLREWLSDDRASSRLVVVTRGAVEVSPGEGIADLAGAAVWGLVRSVQAENPGRVVLVDLPASGGPPGVTADDPGLLGGLSLGEPELAMRDEVVYVRRLTRPVGGLVPPEGGPWRLEAAVDGTLDGLALVPHPDAAAPLGPGQVRIEVRAAGVNFRDVVVSLGVVGRGGPGIGGDVAGVVLETGPGVRGLAAGDRVLGLAEYGFGPVAVTDARLLVTMPEGWSFAAAAAVPVAFTTAWYALADLARARPGERVLVHAAAGGVGMAAVGISRHLGLEVYGTAAPAKHGALAALGLDERHIASSRTAEFGDRFGAVDIVLNSLAGDLTDASLRLLGATAVPGGRFIEMGKTDIRDPGVIARDHPGVRYRAFDLTEADPGRLGEILRRVVDLLARGELAPLPVRCWDVRRAPKAFRFMSQARHTGKIVLTIPADPGAPAVPREPGTVLVTGGTGLLGGLAAGHLAATGRAAEVVLASRSGPAAPGVPGLAAGMAARGTGVRVVACDAADREALAGLLAGVRLTGVVHAAGVLDDGVAQSLTPERIDAVMRPKADAAWHLHELTQDADLRMFVLFAAAAATLGSAGQGNYSAANAFLDALAAARQAAGLPAVSLAWGLWDDPSAMTGRLRDADRIRMARGGVCPLSADEGLALLDAALGRDEPSLVPCRLDIAALRAQAAAGGRLPPLLRDLAGPLARPAAAPAVAGPDPGPEALRQRLAGMPGPEQDRAFLDLVRMHAAAVLGHSSPQAVSARRPFSELGFDSLTAVELRNRLNAATGLRLPATLVFERPTPGALADHLREKMCPDAGRPPEAASSRGSRPSSGALMDDLLRIADLDEDALASLASSRAELIDTMDAESLVRMAFDGESTDL
jgi:candicidin polyketide synthase FscB